MGSRPAFNQVTQLYLFRLTARNKLREVDETSRDRFRAGRGCAAYTEHPRSMYRYIGMRNSNCFDRNIDIFCIEMLAL